MTRDDHIHATVAAGMQDSEAILEALQDWMDAMRREGGTNSILADIAHHVAETSFAGDGRRDLHSYRLLAEMETYARAALTAKADDDLPQPDDEETDDE